MRGIFIVKFASIISFQISFSVQHFKGDKIICILINVIKL